ncbi:hypothetical protein BDF19DRAFT_411527 [Syncephalis fuscata]|nr:hypothetical protein BDF19DRAFT_411527 [Syncephalis fuscata]
MDLSKRYANIAAMKLWSVVLACLFISSVHASLELRLNDTALTLNTANIFREPNVEYSRHGKLIFLPLDSKDCQFTPLDGSKDIVQKVAKEAAQSPDTGIIVSWSNARRNGCRSIAQLATAAQKISDNLKTIGFPPVSYLAIMSQSADELEDWGPNTVKSTGLPSLNPSTGQGLAIALINQQDTTRFYNSININDNYSFIAKSDPGPWNRTFTSRGYFIFQWVMFGLIAVSAVVALGRAFWQMIRGAYFYGDSRTILLIVSIMAAIVSAFSFSISVSTRIDTILKATAFCLSCCAFAILCWYWTNYSYPTVHSNSSLETYGVVGDLPVPMEEILIYYITLAEIPITSIAFACFGTWFLRCSFKKHLGKLSKRHATELSILCFTQAVLFGMSTAINIIEGVNNEGRRYGTITGYLYASIIDSILITVQVMIALWAPPVPLKSQELADEDFTAQLVTSSISTTPTSHHPSNSGSNSGSNRTSMVSIWTPTLEGRGFRKAKPAPQLDNAKQNGDFV